MAGGSYSDRCTRYACRPNHRVQEIREQCSCFSLGVTSWFCDGIAVQPPYELCRNKCFHYRSSWITEITWPGIKVRGCERQSLPHMATNSLKGVIFGII